MPTPVKMKNELTKEIADDLEKQSRQGLMALKQTGKLFGVSNVTISKWKKTPESYWDKYQRSYNNTIPVADRVLTHNEITETYRWWADFLAITVYGLTGRVQRMGLDDPRVFTKGPLPRGGSCELVSGTDEWHALSNRKRDHVLDNIPNPTKFEKRRLSCQN